MNTPSSSPSSPHILAQYAITVREYRHRVRFIFFLLSFIFGGVGYLFFDQTLLQASMITAGLILTVIASLLPSRLHYTFSGEGVTQTDYSGDRFGLHTYVPFLAALAVFSTLFFGWPAHVYIWIGTSAILLIVGARCIFPSSHKAETRFMAWNNVIRWQTEPARNAIMLHAADASHKHNDYILIRCHKGQYAHILDLCTMHTTCGQPEQTILIK